MEYTWCIILVLSFIKSLYYYGYLLEYQGADIK